MNFKIVPCPVRAAAPLWRRHRFQHAAPGPATEGSGAAQDGQAAGAGHPGQDNQRARWQKAASIFLDALKVFLFFLRIFSREN